MPADAFSWYQRIIDGCTTVARFAMIGAFWGLGLQMVVDGVSGSGAEFARYGWFLGISLAVLAVSGLVRHVTRRRLRAMRRLGIAVRRTLTVGAGAQITALMDRLAGDTEHPYVVVGACVEGDNGLVEDVPQVGELPAATGVEIVDDDEMVRRVVAALDEVGADTVCLAPGSQFHGTRLRALSWALSERNVDLVTELGMVDVSPHRLWMKRAASATVLHIGPARFGGPKRVVKAAFDRFLAALLVVGLAPLLLTVAVAVRTTSSGPVIYRQARVGRGGELFTMMKFRSMYVDADDRRADLVGSVSADGPMFKMYDDPRITRVGRLLRRYSLDELPQLFNVIRGDMSLVGPRPPLPEEVATYNHVESRRLLVTPGMTGLWQVSGRSNLTWEETVRLDLRYVDNWTIGGDVLLLGRTAGAVVRSTGAY